MRVLVASLLATCASGCLYLDPINERPAAEIVRDSVDLPYRGDVTHVHASVEDPDHDPVTFGWKAFACAAGGTSCEPSPYQTGTEVAFAVQVPTSRPDVPQLGAVVVTLDVEDRPWGAIARPQQQLVIDVQDRGPTLALQRAGRDLGGHFPVTVPIRVTAAFDDPDGDLTSLTWQLFPAAGSDPDVRAWAPLPLGLTGVEAYELVPDVDGLWTVRVTATDALGASTSQDLAILVSPDQPPCLGALDPGVAADTTIIVDAPRRFAVLSVDDDINVFPAPSVNDPYLRAATFAWSIAGPDGGGFAPVAGLDAADVVIDPAAYRPGDVLDLRVEIGDAVARTLPCDPAAASCSVDGSSCRQRQTWHLEIR